MFDKSKLPTCGGVYVLRRAGKVAYIGMSKNVRNRIVTHTFKEFDSVRIFRCEDETKRRELEMRLIRRFNPAANNSASKAQVRISQDSVAMLERFKSDFRIKFGVSMSLSAIADMLVASGDPSVRKTLGLPENKN